MNDYIQRAKELLYAKLAEHPDEGVRALNAAVELADDNPAVLSIAKALEDRAALQGSDRHG